MTTQEMLDAIQNFKEKAVENGFEKPDGLDEFFADYWLAILDILDDALYNYLYKRS